MKGNQKLFLKLGLLLSIVCVQAQAEDTKLCYPNTAKTTKIVSASDLNVALRSAVPGDLIQLGTATFSGTFSLSENGTAAKPIVVMAAPGAKPVFTGAFEVSGAYTVLSKLTFDTAKLNISGNHVRITRNLFTKQNGGIIKMQGAFSYVRVDHNEFKSFGGSAIEMSTPGNANFHQGVRIDNNYFFDHTVVDSNESVARMLTDSWHDSGLVYESNLFDKVLQKRTNQSEVISLKTAGTIIRGNTFTNSGNISLTFRETNRSIAESNYFAGGARMMVFGDDNIIRKNKLVDQGAIEIRAGDGTMDSNECRLGKATASVVKPNGSCASAHAASRRAQVSYNVGTIKLGIYFDDNNVPAQDTTLTGNSGTIQYFANHYKGVKVSSGGVIGAVKILTPSLVGIAAKDISCANN